VKRKGLDIAVAVAREAGRKLLVAGQVTPETKAEWIKGPNLEYLGVLGHKERAKIMAKARCVLVPTIYIEPFGGVAVESQMSGTPACTTDHGAFTETVLQGTTGYRCVTLMEWVNAMENAHTIKPKICRDWALKNFELAVIGPRYMHYFRRIMDLWNKEGVNSKRVQDLKPREISLPR
jgi:glycosyltransferase involved in cell wall biosynthesis